MENTFDKPSLKVGILGYGEVGRAVAAFYSNPAVKDIKRNNFPSKLDILHVCIPDGKKFLDIVSGNILQYKPNLVIIQSTIHPGTTQQLYNKFKNVAHSPVRGQHPNLENGVRSFVKYIGCDDMKLGKKIEEHFHNIGIKHTRIFKPSITTEIGKLFDTTYYGLCIAFHAYAKKICDQLGVDFDNAITSFNETYNQGYILLGKKNVIRPVLYAPKNDIIAGHCVIANTKILKRAFGNDEILESILRHSKNETTKRKSYIFNKKNRRG